MAANLEQVVKQLEDSGIVAAGKLENFVPPKAHPKSVEELVAELVKQNHLTKFQAQHVTAGKAKSLILGGYTIIDKIGAGGMGQVFKAEHRRMKRLVAIKMLPPAMTKDAAAAARFQREVEAAAKLLHSNIVAAHDADEANGVHFLVMEYVEGKDLSALVKKNGPFPVAKAVSYILQAARGLEFAHKKGVVHRDIKPANLLLDNEGTVKILDMGLARLDSSVGGEAGPQAELTGTGTIMGTVDYMSPEQAFNTKHADARADIYSLGCSLHYLIAGKATYAGETIMEKLLAHREKPIPSLRDAQTDVPEQVETVFKKMVAKKIEDRYQTMTEVVADLEKCQAALATAATSSTSVWQSSAAPEESDMSIAFAAGRIPSIPSSSEEPLPTARTKKPRTVGKQGPPGKNTKLLIGAGAGGLLAVLLAVWVIVKDDKGNEIAKVKVPEGGSLEVRLDKPDAVATNTTSQPTVPVNAEGAIAPKPLKAPFDAKQAHAGQAAWAKHLGTTVEQKNPVGMTLVLIPPVEFLMGSTDEQVAAALKVAEEVKADQATKDRIEKAERPQHRVVITKPLLMSATEVTVGQFRKFVEASKYVTEAEQYGFGNSGDKALSDKVKPADRGVNWKSPGYVVTDESPVAQITWNDACAYCAWLSEQDQRTPWYRTDGKGGWLIAAQASGYRLPTEAEWEYACRAGTTTQYSFGDGYAELEQYGWYSKNAGGKAQPVALKLPNPFGLFDMHGNLYEWCQDFYDEKWYEKPQPNVPKGPSSGSNRVLRGGYWNNNASSCRSASRHSYSPSNRYYHFGFRCVRVADAATNSQLATNTTTQPAPPVTPAAPQPNQPWNTPAFQQWVRATQALPAEQQIEAVSKKLMELNPGFDGKMTGGNGKGTPTIESGVVTELRFFTDNVTDLSPLRALAGLRWLNCTTSGLKAVSKVFDLSPLQGMKLRFLRCDRTSVSDLSPLVGMPLTELYCPYTNVSDLSPVRGMPLTNFSCSNTQVSDLSPLKGMPLTSLVCHFTAVSDLSPLQGMKLLEFGVTPKNITKGLEVVRQMTSLKIIRIGSGEKEKFPPAEFWKKYDAGEFGKPAAAKLAYLDPAFQQWVKATQALPAEKQIEAVSKKLMELNPGFDGTLKNHDADGTPKIENGVVTELRVSTHDVTDISPLRALAGLRDLNCDGRTGGTGKLFDLSPLLGMSLTQLYCANTQVSDLSPLQGMPLTIVSCHTTLVSDLSPLKGMRLTTLTIGKTAVSDLTPVQGMPLRLFTCHDTSVSDLSPLEGMDLTTCRLTPSNITEGLDVLRRMKGLREIRDSADERFSPAEFWKKYDAGEFGKPAAPAKLAYLDPAFQQWVKATQALPAEQQIEAVSKKLMELNPGFDGRLAGFDARGKPHEKPKVEGNHITEIGFFNDHVSDLSPVRAFPKLQQLACYGSAAYKKGILSDLSPLSGMSLTKLTCSDSQVADLSPLQGMRLTWFACGATNVRDLSPLKGMELKTLHCSVTAVRDLSPLQGMPINELGIHGTPVSDLSPLTTVPKLEKVDVKGTKVTPAQIAALQKALPNCKIEWDDPAKAVAGQPNQPWNTSAFQAWVKETQALPAEQQIEAVSKKLMELNPGFDGNVLGPGGKPSPKIENGVVTELSFFTDNVTDVSPLRALAGLKVLYCPGLLQGKSMLSDLSPLEGMPLKSLGVYHTQASDLSPLQDCKSLISLVINKTKVTPASVAALQKALPNCKIEWDDPSKTVAGQPNNPWNTPAFQAWVKATQALPAEQQVDAVRKKLVELNPGFDGKLTQTPKIETGIVTEFRFSTVHVTDISPLLVFAGLKSLSLAGWGQLSDLSPLKGMPLTRLDLYTCTQIADIEPLKGMPLTFLNLGYSQVRDLTPLKDMQLKSLNLMSCRQVRDISPLKGMPLNDLYMFNVAEVQDLSALAECKSLKSLVAGKTKVTPASVAALQKAVPNCKIEWDDPSKPATKKLAYLDPAFQQWVKATQALPAEKLIEAVSKKLMELNPAFDGKVTGNPTIENGVVTEFRFMSSDVHDLSPVRALAGLRFLNCSADWSKTGVLSDLSPLQGMQLTTLVFERTNVSSLSPLQGMPLTSLVCSGTKIVDLSPLQGTKLTMLECNSTKVADLSQLKGLPLATLNCGSSEVSDLSPLRGMNLTKLICVYTKVSDLSPLTSMTTLSSLYVQGTKVTPAQVAALQKALPNCKVEWDDPAKPKTPEPAASGSGTK